MLTQLALSGVLRRVAGVVFGQCINCSAPGPSYGGFTLSQVLKQHLEPLGVPAFQGALIGHVPNQFSIPVGVRAELDAGAGTIGIMEPRSEEHTSELQSLMRNSYAVFCLKKKKKKK